MHDNVQADQVFTRRNNAIIASLYMYVKDTTNVSKRKRAEIQTEVNTEKSVHNIIFQKFKIQILKPCILVHKSYDTFSL